MRTMFAIAVAASIVSVAPAIAQSAGYYGAPSGHNTPGSGVDMGRPDTGYNDAYNNGGYNNGGFGYGDNRDAEMGYGYGDRGYGNRFGWDNAPGRDSFGVPNPSGAIEGRAAATDDVIVPDRMHRHHRHIYQDDQDMDR